MEAWLADTLGMQVQGKTEFEILPHLGASFSDVVVMEGKTVLFSAKKVAVGIELLPLLRKEVQVATLHLEEPVLTVRRDENGTFNVKEALRRQGVAKLPTRLLAGSGAVDHGTLRFSDEVSGAKMEFGDLDLEFEDLRRGPNGQLSFTGRLRAGRLRVNAIEMQDLSGMLSAKEGVYRAEPHRLTLFGGGVKGWLSADLSGGQPSYRAEFSAGKISLAKLYRDITGKELLEGPVSMQAELSAHGPGRIVDGLNGRVKITGTDIILHGFDLDGFIEDYRKSRSVDLVDIGSYLFAGPVGVLLRKSYEIKDLYRNLNKEKSETLEEIVFNWTIENGMARTEDVAFRTKENRVAFQGSVDLPRRHYDEFTLGVLDHQGCAEITEEITGPLSNPTVKKTGLVQSLAGPLVGVLSMTLEILDPRECKPFYSGQVTHPQK
jgi:hypothetical protein